MKNWARNVTWNPTEIAYPTSEEEVQQIVLRAISEKKKIRTIGTGHSFTALCATDEILISLDKYQGLIHVDQERMQVTVKAGTKLNLLGDLLFAEGLAMENLGDIDVQSIAGTISTSTHGTGKNFGTISTQLTSIQFINGKGEKVYCSTTENQDLFKAAQVSLGTMGIITQLTIQCVPVYKLEISVRAETIPTVFSNLQNRIEDNRNFEFFWMPYTNASITKTSNIVDSKEVDKKNMFNYWSEYVVENYCFKAVCEFGSLFPSKTEAISKFSAKLVSDVRKVQYSHKVYATPRLVKFREMEYNIPAEAFDEVWKDVVKICNSKKFPVHFPLECRWVKADDIFMSPAYERDSAYIACHVYYKKECKPYFKALEEVFRANDGRPHWGKMNTIGAQDIEEMYPKFASFLKHRTTQDPNRIFMSPYLLSLFGLEHQA